MSRLSYGQLEVDLGGDVYVLKPTLDALERIDTHFGSVRAAAQAVQEMQFAAIVKVVMFGAGVERKKERELAQKIFDAGMINLVPDVARFLTILLNPSGDNEDEDEAKKARASE